MSRLRPEKLHVRFSEPTTPDSLLAPRTYTLTHSDTTGDLFLTIGATYDQKQIRGWYTRLMRDEVLAEWGEYQGSPALHVHCHVSGGIVLGLAGWRYKIFRYHMPMVLEAFRYGDRVLLDAQLHLDRAPILVHYHAWQRRHRRIERWGTPADYQLSGVSGRS
ncbi:MAG: staygreen family protein [Anaerolineae bacterium]|jgi:hypothetical protein